MSRRRRGNRGSQRKPPTLVQRILRNRYDPHSRRVSINDVLTNIKTIWYAWSHRVTPGSRLHFRDGKIVGHSAAWLGKR
jgi:hypothetical protein